MKETTKTVTVFIAEDGEEFFSKRQCEEHEEKLKAEKTRSLTKAMGEATMRWIKENEAEWRKTEARILGLDEWGRTQDQRLIDETLDLEPLRKEDFGTFLEFHHARRARAAQFGILQEWWMDANPSNDPIGFPIVQKISDLAEHETTMAHVLAKHGIFKSVNDAKKNGWSHDVTPGVHWFKKKTVCIEIINDTTEKA